MHRIDGDAPAVALPTPAAVGATVGYFTEGDPNLGIAATEVTADWLNAVQEEITYVIEQAGLVLDKTSRTQLKSAIDKLVGVSSSPQDIAFADSPYTALATARQITANTAGGAITVNLPAVAGVLGKRFMIIKRSSDVNAVTLDANSTETINGALTQTLDNQYDAMELLATSQGWVII